MIRDLYFLVLIITLIFLYNANSNPTRHPTRKPTAAPTRKPTRKPTFVPTSRPSAIPSSIPTANPTSPTSHPTSKPSIPTSQPTSRPSIPTSQPTSKPSTPTGQPSSIPSNHPTSQPSSQPTNPTSQPTSKPSIPTGQPSSIPSNHPTSQPSSLPTNPTSQPTSKPSTPTGQPSRQPSRQPTSQPTSLPTNPTSQPTSKPTTPTGQPSRQPSNHPTSQPTRRPSSQPSSQPTSRPSHPSCQPTSLQPTARPTHHVTPSPTDVIPIMSFTSTLTLSGLASLTLDENSQIAIIKSAAKAMSVEPDAVTMDQFNTYQSSISSRIMGFTLPSLLSVTNNAKVTVLTSLSLLSNPYSSPEEYYNSLTQQLTSSVSSGTFDNYLNQYAPSSSAVYGSRATAVTNSEFTLAGISPSSSNSEQTLDTKTIAGIVVGVIIGMLLGAVLIYLERRKYISFNCLNRRSKTSYSNMNNSNTKSRQPAINQDETVEVGYNRRNDLQDWSSNTKIETREEGVSPFSDIVRNSPNNFKKGKKQKDDSGALNSITKENDNFEFQSHKSLQTFPPYGKNFQKTTNQPSLSNFHDSIRGDPLEQINNVPQSNDIDDIFNNFSETPIIKRSQDGWNTFSTSQSTIHDMQQQSSVHNDLFDKGSTNDIFNNFSNVTDVQNSWVEQQPAPLSSPSIVFKSHSQQPVAVQPPVNASNDMFNSFSQQHIAAQPMVSASNDMFNSLSQQPVAVQPTMSASNDMFNSFSQQHVDAQPMVSASNDMFNSFSQQHVAAQPIISASNDMFNSFSQQPVQPSVSASNDMFNSLSQQPVAVQPTMSASNDMFNSFSQQPVAAQPMVSASNDMFNSFSQQHEAAQPIISASTFNSLSQQPVAAQPAMSESNDMFNSLSQQPVAAQPTMSASNDMFNLFSLQSDSSVANSPQATNPFLSPLPVNEVSRSSTQQPPTDLFHKFISDIPKPSAQQKQASAPQNPFDNIHTLIPPKKNK